MRRRSPLASAVVTLALVLSGLPPAAAQAPAVPSGPHPTMPWHYPRPDPGRGEPIRYIPVAPRSVVVERLIDTPQGVPRQTEQQTVEIPGYVVTETTTGFLVPEHWELEHLNVGVYRWRRVPETFRYK